MAEAGTDEKRYAAASDEDKPAAAVTRTDAGGELDSASDRVAAFMRQLQAQQQQQLQQQQLQQLPQKETII